MSNPTLPNANLGKTVVTTAKGDVTVVKNFIHELGVTHPITLAVLAFVAGQALMFWLHV